MTRSDAEDWAAFTRDFAELVRAATAHFETLSSEEARRRPRPAAWSIAEIVGHLVDSASNNHQRFLRARWQDDLVFPSYAQDDWVAAQRWNEADWRELVALWSSFNLQLARVLQLTPLELRQRERARHNFAQIAYKPWPAEAPATLEWFQRDYVDHLEHHLAQAGVPQSEHAQPAAAPGLGARDALPTEQPNARTAELDTLDALAAVELVLREDRAIPAALFAARAEIARAVELVAQRLASGGRLFYLGAGTSGRLGVLDAAECPPTFQSPPELVQGLIAGGEPALLCAVEGAEDDRELAGRMLRERGLAARDVVFAIAAGGTTPFAHGALAAARAAGAASIFLACVPREQVADAADISIRVLTGPEVLAGSTRLKAGTATKQVLNIVSTLAMARLGKVHGNLMVDVDTRANAKLVQRAISLVQRLTGLERAAAEALLERAQGGVKAAAVMHARACELAQARARLEQSGGRLRAALK